MDRREALKKLAVGGATAAGVTAVMTSTIFADGGTVSCQPTALPTPSPALSLTAFITDTGGGGLGKDAVRITSNTTSLVNAVCGVCHSVTPTQVVQYRWTVDTFPAGAVSIVNAATGTGNIISGVFQAPMTHPVYLRNSSGSGNLPAGDYSVRLTVRWVCTSGAKKAWACRHWIGTFTYSSSGPNGTVTSTATASGSGNSAACDSPAP